MARVTSKPNSYRSRSRARFTKALRGVVSRMFCKRSIIIISDHKTQHLPFHTRTQLLSLLVVTAVVAWGSYSGGSYMAARHSLEEKERKLASVAQENVRVAAEFTLLKSDLMKLAAASKNGKTEDYVKALTDRYANNAPIATRDTGNGEQAVAQHYDAVLKRLEYLENKVHELQETHDEMIADIRTATGGKIAELERVIAKTGIEAKPLEKAADAKRAQDEQAREKYGRIEGAAKDAKATTGGATAAGATAAPSAAGGQGGPFIPARSSMLKEKETELYFNLQRLMALNDIVHSLPLDTPLAPGSYKQTSGFGNRTDPFNRRLAFHSGVDLSGPDHGKVFATNDGKVEFAGWQSAYGNVVDVKHAYGITTRYAHLARVLVQPEQIVKKGQAIGIQGSTGRSTGHHLHYEVRYQGKPINPANFLKAGEDVKAVN